MFKTMRCFRMHAPRKRILRRKRRENCQNLSVSILTSYFAAFFFFFFFSPCCVWIWNTQMNYGGICLASTPVLFLIPIDIRREERKRAFIFAVCDCLLTSLRFDDLWYLQKCSFVFLIYFMTRRLHKNEQNLENRGCVENGFTASDVSTILGFVHVTWMTLFTERRTVGFDAWQLVQTEMFSMMDETSLEVQTWNTYLLFLTAEGKLLLWLPRL